MISWEHAAEAVAQPLLRRAIRDEQVLERFRALRGRYVELVARSAGSSHQPSGPEQKYAWERWTAELRAAFAGGVPLNFLAHPMLRHTMVYARRRGIRATRARARIARSAFSEQELEGLLREDYPGLPTITSRQYLTSANRSHHAAHLAAHTRSRGGRLWDADSILEWGGGYGNMARIIRRMNPRVTYTIIDLPELLALQYIYLASLEGEDAVRFVDGQGQAPVIEAGRINLMTSDAALRWTALPAPDVFISTWALTESPAGMQRAVLSRQFFGAGRFLLGVMKDAENHLGDGVGADASRMPLPPEMGIPAGNEYWCR